MVCESKQKKKPVSHGADGLVSEGRESGGVDHGVRKCIHYPAKPLFSETSAGGQPISITVGPVGPHWGRIPPTAGKVARATTCLVVPFACFRATLPGRNAGL